MNTPDTLNAQDEIFSIEQLESRFEMLAVPPLSDGMAYTNWSCTLTFSTK